MWNADLLQNPHAVADKRRRVQAMFSAIAPSYDLNNHLHSLWMDHAWRRAAVKMANLNRADVVIDVACGTGDLTLQFASELRRMGIRRPMEGQVIGIDFTYAMLPIAREKAGDVAARFVCGDALALALPDACADVVSIAFGIRNVANPAAAIAEFYRILRPGGRLIVLEFSLPTNPLLRGMYNVYFHHVLPRTATWISRDVTGAYRYLPQSVNTFIGREQMVEHMASAGFSQIAQKAMTFGICVGYRGVKG